MLNTTTLKVLLVMIALCSAVAGQTTPNLNLNIPPTGTPNWGTLLNQNFSSLDSFLSGGTALPAVTVTNAVTASEFCIASTCITTWPSGTVTAVFGRTGAVTAQAGDYSFSLISGTPSTTQVPFQSLTTTGSSGAASLIGGVLNIPQYSGSSGTVTSVGLAMPSWLTVTNSPVTTSGTLTAAPTTAQTSHEVIGTCGSATAFTPCALVAGDIPTLNQNTSGTAAGLSAILVAGSGGTGVANTATLTLGSSNQNWASLGTGIVKNTTTTGALSDAASSDVIGLWSGSCSSSTYLNGAGACATPSGSGTVTASAQYDVAYYPTSGTVSTVQGAAISGFQFDSTSAAPVAATAANLGSLLNIAQYSELYSNGTSAAVLGLAAPTTNADWFTGYHVTGSAASAPVNEELVASTTNSDGLTVTPTYSATGPTQRFEITGNYSGSLASGTGLTSGQIPNNAANTSGSAGSLSAALALSGLATQATNTIVGNATSGTAVPTALAIGSCSGATNALIWTTNTGFGCNTISGGGSSATGITNTSPVTVAANSTSDQTLMELALTSAFLNSTTPIHFFAAGLYSTGTAQTPTLQFKVKLCTVSGCGSGTVVTLYNDTTTATTALVTNQPWNITLNSVTVTTGSSGTLEVHGNMAVDLGALATTSDTIYADETTAVSSAINLTGLLYLDVTVATSTGNTGNSITQRLGIIAPYASVATTFSGNTTTAASANSNLAGAATGLIVTTDGSGNVQSSGFPVSGYTVFSTGVTGTSMATSGTNTVVVGPTTMVTPSAAGNYEFTIEISQTTTGSGGTCATGTVSVNLVWKSADSGVTYTQAATPTVALHAVNSTTLGTTANMTSAVNGVANDFLSLPMTFRAASGTAISYQVYQNANSNCTTAPVFATRPVLKYLSN